MLQSFPGATGAMAVWSNRPSNSAAFGTATIVAGGTLGTYTATPVDLITVPSDYDAVAITVWNVASLANSGARGDVVIDLMTGLAGSETPIVEGLMFGGRPANSSYTLPLYIPSGTRISGRVAAGVASRSTTWFAEVKLALTRDQTGLPTRWVPYGTNISSGVGAYGTLITPGTNAWSSWAALTTNTTYPHSLWLPMFCVGTGTTITALNYASKFSIASTTDAATIDTGYGNFRGPVLTGATTESLGQYGASTSPVNVNPGDIIYAPRGSGASVSAATLCSSSPNSNAVSASILAAVM